MYAVKTTTRVGEEPAMTVFGAEHTLLRSQRPVVDSLRPEGVPERLPCPALASASLPAPSPSPHASASFSEP